MPATDKVTINGQSYDPFQNGTLALPHSLDNKPTTSKQTVLQQHCAFWDKDEDGVVNVFDTFRGFRELGFNLFLSILAVFIIHSGFSYPSVWKTSYVPDPLFRVFLHGIDKCKHGSDSGSYDSRGYYQPSQFNSLFDKYAETDAEALTVREVFALTSGQRLAFDPFGWGAAIFEWYTTVLLTYDAKSGLCKKENIRRIYDGSLFWHIKTLRDSGRADELPGMTFSSGIDCLRRGGYATAAKTD